MKNIIFSIFIVLSAATLSCGRNESKIQMPKIKNSVAAAALNNDNYAPDVNVQFKGSGGNDAWMLNWYNWYTGGDPKIPTCGPAKLDKSCIRPTADTADSCRHQAAEVRSANFRLGYYLEKVDNYQFCAKKCTPSKPACDDFSCIPNVLSYAGKQILKATQACQGACQDAIAVGMEFPYECKNINDGYDRKALIDEIEAEKAKLLADPQRVAQAEQLSTVTAEREALEKKYARMKKAEAELPSWLKSVYNPSVKSLADDMRKADDKILRLFVRLKQEAEPVQAVATEINKQFSERIPDAAQLEKNRQNLEQVRPKACLVYDFRTAVDEAKVVQDKLKSLTDELLAKLTEVGNIPLYDEGKAGVENLLSKVKPSPVQDALLNGSLVRDICNHYRKMVMVNSLLISKSAADGMQSGLGDLIKSLNGMIAGVDTFSSGLKFRESIVEQSQKITSALIEARLRSQWNNGNRMAFDGFKALHLVLIPSIDLNNDLSDSEKAALTRQITQMIEPAVREWNRKANSLGIAGMVDSRHYKLNNLLSTIMSKIDERPDTAEQQSLKAELQRSIERASLRPDPATFEIRKSGQTVAELVRYDDQLSELEFVVREFIKTNMRGQL